MSLTVAYTAQFKKDYKRAIKRNLDVNLLDDVIRALSHEEPLPVEKRDHALAGNWIGYRECHIQPNWLLVYYVENTTLVLTLTRTGTHSDIFGI